MAPALGASPFPGRFSRGAQARSRSPGKTPIATTDSPRDTAKAHENRRAEAIGLRCRDLSQGGSNGLQRSARPGIRPRNLRADRSIAFAKPMWHTHPAVSNTAEGQPSCGFDSHRPHGESRLGTGLWALPCRWNRVRRNPLKAAHSGGRRRIESQLRSGTRCHLRTGSLCPRRGPDAPSPNPETDHPGYQAALGAFSFLGHPSASPDPESEVAGACDADVKRSEADQQ